MSNPQLNRLLRGNGLTSFHVGSGSMARHATRPIPAVRVEHATFSVATKKEYDFSKKKNREEGKKRKKGDDDSDSDSGSDDDGPHYNHDGIHKKGSDAGVCFNTVILYILF